MVAVAGVPGWTDDGDVEWFVHLGGPTSNRRNVTVGDHLELDHPLVLAWPEKFTPSPEPVDCGPIRRLSQAAVKRQERERRRQIPPVVIKATPICPRCWAESGESAMLVAKPQTNHLINALSGLDDHDPADRAERYRIEREFADQARRHQQGNDDLAVKTARWEMKHTACPPGTALPPEPKVPDDL